MDNKNELVNETIKLLQEEKEKLIEMANLTKRRTKLPVNVWVDEIGSNRDVPHNDPRLKIQNDYGERANGNLIPISIEENPRDIENASKIDKDDLEIIFDWIKENYNLLMQHWNGEIDTDELKVELNKKGQYRL